MMKSSESVFKFESYSVGQSILLVICPRLKTYFKRIVTYTSVFHFENLLKNSDVKMFKVTWVTGSDILTDILSFSGEIKGHSSTESSVLLSRQVGPDIQWCTLASNEVKQHLVCVSAGFWSVSMYDHCDGLWNTVDLLNSVAFIIGKSSNCVVDIA